MISPGVTLVEGGAIIAVASANATAIEFCRFDGAAEHRHRLTERTGDFWHGFVPGITRGDRYGLRAHGPWAPLEGHRFNPNKLLLDPYALQIDTPFELHQAMFGHRDAEALLACETDSAPFMPKAIVVQPLATAAPQITSWDRTIIYELHVRGFTMRHPDVPPELRGTFAGLAHPAAIAHLTRLGVTAVELLPTSAWIQERHLAQLGLQNYWGYNTVGFLAPDPRLAPGGWPEIRAAVTALADAGIETILDVVLNHTGEGDAWGPTLSFRGLDNALYYRLPPTAPHGYIDDTGCGNTLALDRPPMLDLAMDSLRAWALHAGVHGFRFDLAATLGRRPEGFNTHAPLLAAISQDPLLREMKLIAEPWDIGPGGYQMGCFPAAWGEWNDRFRDDTRAFWRGDGGKLGALATRLAGSADLFAARHRPSRGVNFITAHDGFTLADLVSHTAKHNHANGEANRDGTDNNLSWNHGVEGATTNAAIVAARTADQRALLATLLLARGTPMLAMGSEFGQSQAGNSNAYAQDNETAWLDWANADPDLLAWTQHLIAARLAHPALCHDIFLTGDGLLPDVAWLRPDGAAMQDQDWSGDTLAMLLTTEASRACVAFNRGSEDHILELPPARDAFVWDIAADSANPEGEASLWLAPRSVKLLVERKAPAGHVAAPADPATLTRLAAAAGIAPDWWEVDGTHHTVSPDTTRALLAAMRLPAETGGEARDALTALADRRQRRPLPEALVTREGTATELVMPLVPGLSRRPVWLRITRADGAEETHRIDAEDGRLVATTAVDGRAHTEWRVPLPNMPPGRHRLHREDASATACALTVAPRTCFLPQALSAGQRRFGVAAQLYSLRSAGDQGIGDFSTLQALSTATARAGGAAVGLNPLHALFSTDRTRASPYNPSDRRFVDPIYLDLATLEDGLGPRADAANDGNAVDYPRVWARKSAALQARFGTFNEQAQRLPNSPAARAFTAFVTQGGPSLLRFASFQVIAEQQAGLTWPLWPAELRDPASPEVATIAARHAERLRYHQYLQWQCDLQLGRAAGGLEIGLIRDLAVGSAPDGAEAWAGADLLARGVSIGAPPDPFSAEGQVWNLPPPNPIRLQADGYAGFAELLQTNLRHAGGLRIDHVMGLTRLFWVPDGGRGRDGAYVAAPLDDLLGELALASTNAQALIVGEDLGTVPEGLREQLAANNILAYRVLLLERQGHGFKPAASYPTRAMACVSTHDLPTLAGWSTSADITERASLGLLTETAAAFARTERTTECQSLATTLDLPPDTSLPEIATAAHAFIAGTASDLAMVQVDDLALEPAAVNLPGTDTERPNWRRRLATPVPSLLETPMARDILQALRRSGRTQG